MTNAVNRSLILTKLGFWKTKSSGMWNWRMNSKNKKVKERKRKRDWRYLFGMVETFEVIFTEENTVFGFSAGRHALAEIDPEIVATTFVTSDSPTWRHFFTFTLFFLFLSLNSISPNNYWVPSQPSSSYKAKLPNYHHSFHFCKYTSLFLG